jgi:hypothetical protein
MNKNWEKQPYGIIGGGNYILRPSNDTGEFAISYQPSRKLAPLAIFDCETNYGETAICDFRGSKNVYYILNGNHQDAYESLIDQGIEKCLEYYNSRKEECGSSWSTNVPIEEFIEKVILKSDPPS